MGRGISLNDNIRDFIFNSYLMHKDDRNYSDEKMADFCKVSRQTYKGVIKADTLVALRMYRDILDIADEITHVPSKDTLLWASKKHGWEYDDLIATARKAVAQEQKKIEASKSTTLQTSDNLTQVEIVKDNPKELKEIVEKLDLLISCVMELKSAIDNSTQTIPQNININTSEEISALCKKLDTGAISVKVKGIKDNIHTR